MKYKLKWDLPHDPVTCLGHLLDARGIEDIEAYVFPSKDNEIDPYKLDNIETAAQCLIKHLNDNSNILIIQDCDVDGICSAAMVWNYIKDFYHEAKLQFICHEHKAHGLEDIIEEIENSTYELIIIPDASSNDFEEHRRLKEVGKDIIVLDHHEAEGYSKSAIVVNNQLSADYSNKSFCGAGVVYKFLMVMDDLLDKKGHCEKYMDLCSLANIADCMSMRHPETRYYIMEGLKRVENGGFKAFINQQAYSLFKEKKELGYINVAFYIAPLLNAIVRVGTMEEKRLLFTAFVDPEIRVLTNKRGSLSGTTEAVAVEIARRAANARARQNKLKDVATQTLDYLIRKHGLAANKIIVVEVGEYDNIPQELRGLICAQFVNKYGRPCAIVAKNSEGFLRGSIRGNSAFGEVPDFKKFLEDSGYVEYVQGHANAAGLSIHESQLQNLINYANSTISENGLENVYYVDYVFDSDEEIAPLLLNITNYPELWGNDIEEPVVVVEEVPYYKEQWFLMGENKDSCKLKHNGVEYVRFKDAEFAQLTQQYDRGAITVYGKIRRNLWNGVVTPQILIDDYEFKDTTDEF